MRAWFNLLFVLICCALLMSCGGGGPTIPATVQNHGDTLTASSSATAATSTPTVRLTVKTNFPVADQYFVIKRPENPDGWDQPQLHLINTGYEFWLSLPVGALYSISLGQVDGASFTLPDEKLVDLRSPTVAELERTLEYGDLDEHGQRRVRLQ